MASHGNQQETPEYLTQQTSGADWGGWMAAFEEQYLLCDIPVSLIPGPKHLEEPFYSTELQEMEEYSAEEVAHTLTHLNGVTLVTHVEVISAQDWYAWRWRLDLNSGIIEIGYSVFEDLDPVLWGGSELNTLCTFTELVCFWRAFQDHYPAAWLHDDTCRMYTPHSFLATYAIPRLRPALTYSDPAIRARAERACGVP